MNSRNKLAAALLAFFLGGFGAHWFYLGDTNSGTNYLIGFLLSLALTFVLVGWLGIFVLGVMCLIDFVRILGMCPNEFDAIYNPRYD